MGEKKKEEKRWPGLKNVTFYDPANPPYETHHVCTLLGELDREAEKGQGAGCKPQGKRISKRQRPKGERPG
ncbi:MAG: hypothetical protein MUO52_06140 [Desulfobacterales bacterium]|nr:hypothetical protein [Desulfobacterales bacterium]